MGMQKYVNPPQLVIPTTAAAPATPPNFVIPTREAPGTAERRNLLFLAFEWESSLAVVSNSFDSNSQE
jgi:hypothetical protein